MNTMRLRAWAAVCCAVILSVLVAPAFAQAQTSLRWRFTAGDKLRYVIEEKTITRMEASAQAGAQAERFDLTSRIILDTTWIVRSVNAEGTATLAIVVNRVQFSADGKGGAQVAVAFDSRAKDDPVDRPARRIAEVFRAALGADVIVAVGPSGQVTRVGPAPKLSAAFDSILARELAGFFGDVFTADGFQNRLVAPVLEESATLVLDVRTGKLLELTRIKKTHPEGAFGLKGALEVTTKVTRGEGEKVPFRVGTFTRRQVLIAFYHSEFWQHELQAMMADVEKARAVGDQKKVAELEAKGAALQAEAHRQLIGQVPLTNVLDHLKKDLAAVANEAGVSLIVEEPPFRDSSIEVIDVTPLLVKRLPPAKAK